MKHNLNDLIKIPDIIRPPCLCVNIYAPVCGVNGRTYRNECWLRCAGVRKRHDGPCFRIPPIYVEKIPWKIPIPEPDPIGPVIDKIG